ncbi:hypothetical protein PMAYCL1PPCAC_29887 [Pristionchus mayeri]|uniref:ATP synthase subunit s, mitochondrial n=1 Tax=Pristionchus mayeri TaxID=1317129 RepID=A0AAN5DCJ6_9BILA|nr:hypothetical protein PMAYCL1PPCAC_29887 [Pristionchus mayeri]
MLGRSLECSCSRGNAARWRLQQARWISAFPSFKIASLRRIIAERTSNNFNESRVHEIGPDLAALEWLMECGATKVEMSDGTAISSQREMRTYLKQKMDPALSVRVSHASSSSHSSLRTLSRGDNAFTKKWPNAPKGVYLDKVDASDSAIANEGFKYLREVHSLHKLKLNFCDYFGDEALRELAGGRPANTLEDIEIVLNPSVSDGAVYSLTRLTALRRAHFYFLPYVSNRTAFIRAIKIAIPRCTVTFPEATRIGYGYDEKELEK